MNIEQKIDAAKELLYNVFLAENRNETLRISSLTLDNNGLGGYDFFEIICPRLKQSGILKDFFKNSSEGMLELASSESFVYPADKQRYDEIQHEIFETGFPIGSGKVYIPGAVAEFEGDQRDKMEYHEGLEIMRKLPRYHKFIVDGAKLEKDHGTEKNSNKMQVKEILGEKNTPIHKIEVVRRSPNNRKVKIVVNENYHHPAEFTLGKNWSQFYELAEKGQIVNKKGFFDYFNSNAKNPLYARLGYKPTQILKSDGAARIVPNIPIELITDRKIAQRKKKAA